MKRVQNNYQLADQHFRLAPFFLIATRPDKTVFEHCCRGDDRQPLHDGKIGIKKNRRKEEA